MLGAEAGHVHAAAEVEGVHELADGDVVGVVAVDVPPQREVDGLVLDQGQRPHRVELVLAVLEGGGQGDVHALVLDALDRPGTLPGEVRDEHHVLVGEGRDELLAQSVGDRLQPVDDVAGRHQRVPELGMVEVVAMDLEDGAGAACVPAERVLESEGLHRGGEHDRVLLRERVVELPEGGQLVGRELVVQRAEVAGELGVRVAVQQTAAVGRKRTQRVGGDLEVQRPHREHPARDVAGAEEAQHRHRVSRRTQPVAQLDDGLVVAGGSGDLVGADHDHSGDNLPQVTGSGESAPRGHRAGTSGSGRRASREGRRGSRPGRWLSGWRRNTRGDCPEPASCAPSVRSTRPSTAPAFRSGAPPQ